MWITIGIGMACLWALFGMGACSLAQKHSRTLTLWNQLLWVISGPIGLLALVLSALRDDQTE
jgi:hypothetical protein